MKKVLCLCPTYGRPKLLYNAIACFQAQTHSEKRLLIFDDLGQFMGADVSLGDDIHIISHNYRCDSLPHKYSVMLRYAEALKVPYDMVAVWDDDDIYLPDYLKTMVGLHDLLSLPDPRPKAIQCHRVYSLYTGDLRIEDTGGRFHGCLTVDRNLLINEFDQEMWHIPSPPKRADFDQQMISKCQTIQGITLDPHYIFRWGSTGANHCQGLMKSGDDTTWYDRYQPTDRSPQTALRAEFDNETIEMYRQFNQGLI